MSASCISSLLVYDFRKISKPAIYILPLNIHNAKLDSNHLFTEESISKKAGCVCSVAFWRWVVDGEFGLSSQQRQLVVIGRETSLRTPLPTPAISSVPLFNNFLSHLAAIMLLFLKQ